MAAVDTTNRAPVDERVLPAALVDGARLRAVAVQRRALLRLGAMPGVRPLMALDLLPDGGLRIVRAASQLPTVGDVLRAGGALPWRDAAVVVRQAGEALQTAGLLGLAHASPSPDRLFVAGPSEVHLDGFGVLAELDALLGAPADPLAVPLPTADRARRTRATESFQVAVLFVVLVTGAAPTTALEATLAAAGVPHELAALVTAALAQEPASRPDPVALLTAFEDAVDGAEVAPSPPAEPLAEARPDERPATGRLPWGKLVLAVVVAAGALTAGKALAGDGEPALAPSPTTTVAPAGDPAEPAAPTAPTVAPAPPTTTPPAPIPTDLAPSRAEATWHLRDVDGASEGEVEVGAAAVAPLAAPVDTVVEVVEVVETPAPTAPPTTAARRRTRPAARATPSTTAPPVTEEAEPEEAEPEPAPEAGPEAAPDVVAVTPVTAETVEPAADLPPAGSEGAGAAG